jgi:hypothetical protein
MVLSSLPDQPAIIRRVETPARKTFRLAVILSLLISTASVISWPFLQPVIPIFYTLAQPDSQLVAKIWIFIFPVFAWLVTLLHFPLLKLMKDLGGSVETLFSWATVGVISVTGLILVRLILLVL